jgi:predicted ribosome quality control (RQC) complex YloA/Tae2 family protein
LRDVAQPGATEVVLRFRGEDDPCLLLSAHATHARAHLVPRFPKSKEKEKAHFAGVLLKHLLRSELRSVEQAGLDRILVLRFSPPPGVLSDIEGDRLLIAELMGKHSNLVLVHAGTNRILESIKHVDESTNRYREVLPGVRYVPPPATTRADPFALTRTAFDAILNETAQKAMWKRLLDAVDGLSPAVAKYIAATASHPDSSDALWEAFRATLERVQTGAVRPTVRYESAEPDAKPLDFGLFPSVGEPFGHPVGYESANAAVTAYYDRLTAHERLLALRSHIRQALDRREEAVLRKLDALRGDLRVADDAELYRLHGELLMASLHKVPERASSVTVVNFYEPGSPDIEIPISALKTPVENAQGFFKQYQKAKRGASVIRQLIQDNEQTLSWIGAYRKRLAEARGYSALTELRDELVQEGWLSDTTRPKRRREKDATPYRAYTTGSGWQILVGRNDRENETLVTRVARKDDLWLHAKELTGSHVLIRNPERKTQVPMPVLLDAAKLAAYFSKGRNSKRVPVDYTFAKYVVRPKGTVAGFVTYTHEKTLFVEPAPLDVDGS